MANNKSDLRANILTNELGSQMLDTVAPIYNNSKVALYLFQSIGITMEQIKDFMSLDFENEDNFISQIFIQTATWGLKYWEDEYGITPDPSLSYEQRRQNLITKLQYTAPITPRKIADRISSLTGIPVTVKEVAGTNAFDVILHELRLDHSEVYKFVDRISPAHLIYTIKTEEEENSALTSYYKIMVSEAENVTVIVRYTVLTDENDYILTNELDEVLTV